MSLVWCLKAFPAATLAFLKKDPTTLILSNAHAQLTGLATALCKVDNDIRIMNSGSRCGLGEIQIPENEPGSSMMPGTANPLQIEALITVCLRVTGNSTAVTIANTRGRFQLSTYKRLIIHSVLELIELLSDSCVALTQYCVKGIEAGSQQLELYAQRSHMYATRLSRCQVMTRRLRQDIKPMKMD